MQRRVGLPVFTFVAVAFGFSAVTGLGFWRLLGEREALLRATMLERQEAVGRAAAALTSSVDRCWDRASELTAALPEECMGVADEGSPYRWVRSDPTHSGTSTASPEDATLRELLRGCEDLVGEASFEGCKNASIALTDAPFSALVEREGRALLERVGAASEAAPEYRRLSYRLLDQALAAGIEEQPEALDKILATRSSGWARLGRFRVTRPCKTTGPCNVVVGLDAEPTPGAIARFVNAANIVGGSRYDLAMVSEERARAAADSISTAFVSPGLGYLSARDKVPPAGLGNLHLLLGVYVGCALLLLGALAVAVLLLDRSARDLRLKQNFVASVSHELRTPLGGVRLMLETMLAGRLPSPERQTEYLESMHRQVVRLSRLAENMLVLQRLERAGKVRLEPCVLGRLVRTATESLSEDAERRGVSLELRSGSAADEVMAESDLLTVAFRNLIHNAIKHSPPGGRVEVAIERATASVALHVRDQGPGIPVRERERVFSWFYRLDDELTRQSEGTGVGLAVVRAVALLHRGDVRFVEPDASGGHVVLSLPLLSQAEDADGKT